MVKKTGDSEYWNFSINFIDEGGPDRKQEIPFVYSLYIKRIQGFKLAS